MHGRDRLCVAISVGKKPRKGKKTKQIKTVQNGLNGSEKHTVVVFVNMVMKSRVSEMVRSFINTETTASFTTRTETTLV